MRTKFGQSAIEFIIMVGFLLAMFVMFLLVIENDRSDEINDLENTQIKEIGLVVKNEVDLATESSDGYVREFKLPRYRYGGNYTITVIDDLVLVSSDDLKHQVSYALKPVTGTIKQDGINVIKKINGEVILNG